MKQTAQIILAIVAILVAFAFINHNAEASKPTLPVSVSYRQAILGPGLVARFTNESSESLELRVRADSPATNFYHAWYLVIPPGRTREIGPLEGWSFLDGQRLELSNVNFRSAAGTVP
jgi:hypothetical protein